MKGIDFHQKTLQNSENRLFAIVNKKVYLYIGYCSEKVKYLLDVIVKTPDSKVRNVIIFSDAFWVL